MNERKERGVMPFNVAVCRDSEGKIFLSATQDPREMIEQGLDPGEIVVDFITLNGRVADGLQAFCVKANDTGDAHDDLEALLLQVYEMRRETP